MKFVPSFAAMLAVGTILAASSPVPAQPKTGERRIERLRAELNLTPEQETQIRAIYEEAKTESADERQELQAAYTAMKSALAGDASDAQLRQQHETIQDLRGELGDLAFETLLEVRQELTPEQRERFAELRAEGRGRRRPGGGPGARF